NPIITRNVMEYLISEKGLTILGASYLTGNLIQESQLIPWAENGPAKGIAQWEGDRQAGMPEDLYGQLDHIFEEAVRDGRVPDLYETLCDEMATVEIVEAKIQGFERYSVEGNRFVYGSQIYNFVRSV
ncbi:MAG TPA: phage tail tip lysozyme, partial [Niastella sp.]|nr:phage tail tip lysozyme [Niastella sp.]